MEFNLEKYKKIRKIVKHNREKADYNKKRSPFFNVDRGNVYSYLTLFPKFERMVYGYLNKLKEEGKPIVYADICGRATAHSFGATYNYSFSIQKSELRNYHKDTLFFTGDIFNKKDVLEFIGKIKANGHRLNYITFEPIVGLQGYNFAKDKEDREIHRQVVWQQLENSLLLFLDILEPGGYIYMSKPFQLDTGVVDFIMRKNQDQYQSSIDMKKFARRNRLRLKIESSIGGPVFLLHKPLK